MGYLGVILGFYWGFIGGSGSLREKEDADRTYLAAIWAGFSESLQAASDLFSDSNGVTTDHVKRLFLDKSFCTSLGWLAGKPKLGQILDFLEAVSTGALQDRGKHRVRSALSVISAMSFAAYKFQLRTLLSCLESPLVKTWRCSDKWSKKPAILR